MLRYGRVCEPKARRRREPADRARSRQAQGDHCGRPEAAPFAERERKPTGEDKVPEGRELPGVLVAVDDRVGAEPAPAGARNRGGVGVDVVRLVVEADVPGSSERVAEPRGSGTGDPDKHQPAYSALPGGLGHLPLTHVSTFLHWSMMSGRP